MSHDQHVAETTEQVGSIWHTRRLQAEARLELAKKLEPQLPLVFEGNDPRFTFVVRKGKTTWLVAFFEDGIANGGMTDLPSGLSAICTATHYGAQLHTAKPADTGASER